MSDVEFEKVSDDENKVLAITLFTKTDRGRILVVRKRCEHIVIQENLMDLGDNSEKYQEYKHYFERNSNVKTNHRHIKFTTILNKIALCGRNKSDMLKKLRERRAAGYVSKTKSVYGVIFPTIDEIKEQSEK